MRKLVVYITMVLNVKLALSFYISIYMQNQCLIFYQLKQWIQTTAISNQNAYKEVFWLKFEGGACPPDPQDCALRANCAPRWNRTPSTMMLSHFSGGNPASL